LTKEWQAVLNDYRIPFLHFCDLFREQKIYNHLTDDQRREILLKTATIAGRNTIRGIGFFVDVQAYDQMMPEWYKKLKALPAAMCLDSLFDAAFGDAEEHAYLEKKNLPVSFFFDYVDPKSDKAWHDAIGDTFYAAKERGNALNLIGDLTLSSKRGNTAAAIPLQAADFLAWRSRAVVAKLPMEVLPLDEAFATNVTITIYTSANMRDQANLAERSKAKLLKQCR
jgi:hypothetical protein